MKRRIKEVHVHKFKPHIQYVALHRYVKEKGKFKKDLISGKDTLKQFKCEGCGAVETLDLERRKA